MSDLLLSLVLQIIIQSAVHLKDAEDVPQGQRIWIRNNLLCKRLHESIRAEAQFLKDVEKQDHLERETEMKSAAQNWREKRDCGWSCFSTAAPGGWSIYWWQRPNSLRCLSTFLCLCTSAPSCSPESYTVWGTSRREGFLPKRKWRSLFTGVKFCKHIL